MSALSSTSTSEVSDRARYFDKNATAEEVRAWILEYACKYGHNGVVRAMSSGDPRKLLQYGILEGRLVAYLLWNCVAENVVEGYDLCVQLLRHTYAHAPLVNFRHYARILYGLKVKVMLHILADKFELCLASSKLKELFPKEGEKLPPVLKLDATLEKQLNQLNRQSAQFRQLVLDLILDREKREAYLQDEMEEEFGAEFSLTLHDLVAKFVQTVEDYLPAPVIEEISSSELYLSHPDGCSPAVSSLLTVLELTDGNPSAASLTQLVHELDNGSTTRTRRRNCLPGRNEVKAHSGFKSPKTKEKKAELHRNSFMKLQSKERGSAIQKSTSTESSSSSTVSSGSQTTVCSGATYITLSDSSDEEIVEVSSELRSDCSPRGKKATTILPRETNTASVTRVKTSQHNKSRVGAETKGSETRDRTTDIEVLNEVEEKARPLKSWNLWENTLRKDLVGSNSRGSKEFESFLEDEQEMQVSTEDTGEETQFSQGSRGEENQGDDSVHDDKTGAERSIIRKEDDPRSDEDFASPLAITLDSSIDSDISSPLLFASLQEDSWKKKRQREDEQLSTEHSRKRQKLDLQENRSEKSSTNIQVPEADMQKKTLNVEKIQLTYQCHERKNTAEEVANQSSCSNELVDITDDKANKSEDEDTCAEGASTSQVSIFPSAERHSVEVVQETPMECTDSCSVVGSLGDTQPFSPDLQEATRHKDDSTTITQHADASTTSEPKDDNLIRKGGTKALTEETRPSEDADGLRLANASFSGSATSITVNRQDFPLTPMESTLCAGAEEHIDASPYHGKDHSPAQWDKMVHCAIQSTPTGVASLADICQYITENFPHHSSLDIVAQSVCRVLSTHKCFQVVSSPREIKWTQSSACGHKFLPGPLLVPTERGSSPVNSDVTSSTPDGIDSASKTLTSNPSGDDRQTSISVMEEEEKTPLPDSESTCATREAITAVLSNKTPESGADTSGCSDNTVSSSQDGMSTVQRTVSSSSSGSNCHTFDMILEKTELEEERDTMLTLLPYSENQEQTHDKSRMTHTDSENYGTEKGFHSQSSDESIIPPSPQEGQRAKFVTFARTRRGLAVPHTCGKAEQEAGSTLAGGEDAIVSDSDSDSESTVLYYEENAGDSDAESYVIPNSHEQDDSFNSVSGPKTPVLGASTRSALWTKNNTLVPSLSQHLSPCPVRPCVVLLQRLRPDDLRPHLKKS